MLLYFVISFCVLLYAKCDEPRSCSQFHFLDRLLEKMIRMELKVETYGEEITKTNNEANVALEGLEREKDEFRNDIAEMKKTLKNELTGIKDALLTPTILFKARTAKDKDLETGQTIVFTDVMFNHGEGYDHVTGVFTAHVNGTYLFNAQLCVNAAKNLYFGIVLDCVVQTSGRFYDKYANMCYSVSEMLYLQAGNKVWINCNHETSLLWEDKTRWNMFSGMLVHK